MIKVYQDNIEFRQEHLNFLYQEEVKNSLMIGISSRLDVKDSHYVASLIGDHVLLGVLAGKNLILSANTLEEDVYQELVEHMEKIPYPGIVGEKNICLAYQKAYENHTKKAMNVGMNQRIYYCKKVVQVSNVEGNFRVATEDDFSVLIDWVYDFIVRIEGEKSAKDSEEVLHHILGEKRLFVLEKDGELLTMCARSRPLNKSETVALVYTPVPLRNHGYASKAVEQLTRLLLEEREMATLYTDLANPTSNSIYQKIGYVPYCDSMMLDII